jgi:hypothetical protein
MTQPTKADKKWFDAICELGCIVCRNEFGMFSPACPHHIDGKTKPGAHRETIPLCGAHHQTGGRGVAIHPHTAVWEELHGNQYDLLEQVEGLICLND